MPAELTSAQTLRPPKDSGGTNNPHNVPAAQAKLRRRVAIPRTNNPQPERRRKTQRRKPRNSSKSARSPAPPAPDRRRA